MSGKNRRSALVVGLLAAVILAAALPVRAAPDREISLDDWRKYQDRLLDAGEKDRALQEFRKRVVEEETALNRYLLGRLYGKLRQLDKAQAEFERAQEIDPLFAAACQGLAICLVATRDLQRAMEELRRAIRLDGGDVESRVMLAGLLAETGKIEKSEAMLREVLRDVPRRVDARFLLAQILLQTRRADKAYVELEAVLHQEPTHAGAQRRLGLCAMLLQKWSVAEAQLRKILEARPDDIEAKLLLVEVLAQTGRFDDARAILGGLDAGDPSEALKKAVAQARQVVARHQEAGTQPRTVDEYVKGLIDRLGSEDPAMRRKVMRTLVKFSFKAVPPAIVKHVTDPDVTVRVLVVRLVGQAAEATSIPLLAIKLRHPTDADESHLVRGACVEALRNIKSAAAVPVLLVSLQDEAPYVLEQAVRALRMRCGARFGGNDVAASIETDLEGLRQGWWRWWRSERAVVQKAAAIEGMRGILKRSKSRTMISYLVPLLEDADPAIFDAAYAALVEATGKSFGEAVGAESRKRIAREAREWAKAGQK